MQATGARTARHMWQQQEAKASDRVGGGRGVRVPAVGGHRDTRSSSPLAQANSFVELESAAAARVGIVARRTLSRSGVRWKRDDRDRRAGTNGVAAAADGEHESSRTTSADSLTSSPFANHYLAQRLANRAPGGVALQLNNRSDDEDTDGESEPTSRRSEPLTSRSQRRVDFYKEQTRLERELDELKQVCSCCSLLAARCRCHDLYGGVS